MGVSPEAFTCPTLRAFPTRHTRVVQVKHNIHSSQLLPHVAVRTSTHSGSGEVLFTYPGTQTDEHIPTSGKEPQCDPPEGSAGNIPNPGGHLRAVLGTDTCGPAGNLQFCSLL